MKGRLMNGNVLFFVLLCIIIVTGTSHSAVDKVNMGVFGAQVHDIAAYDNSGTSEILIAIDSIQGIYKWNSGSSQWDSVAYPLIVGKGQQIEANLNSGYEDDIYAIIDTSSGSGVYVSDSGGGSGSWSSIVTAISNPSVLVGHSSGIYVGTRDGDIYRNTSGYADSFSLIYSAGSGIEITSVAVYDAYTLFVMGMSGGSLVQFDDVDLSTSPPTTTDLTPYLPSSSASGSSFEAHLVGVDPGDVNTLFIAGSSVNPQVYRSDDRGGTWASSWDFESSGSDNFPGGYPQYIKFDNNRVFTGASVLEKSVSWATTWSHSPNLSSTVGTSTVMTHPNDGALEVDPVDSTILYLGTDWGLGQMNHATGTGWTAGSEIGNNDGMEGVILNDMDFYEYSPTSKELWVAAKSGIGRALHFDPTDPTSTASPSDWIFPIYPLDDGAPFHVVRLDPTDPATVFAGNNGGAVYKTTNGTSTSPTWSNVFRTENHPSVFGSTRPDHCTITSIAFVPSSCSRIYMAAYNWETGTDGGVYYSDDGGGSWTLDKKSGGTDFSGIPVNTLWVTDNEVWAGVGSDTSSETGLRWRLSICSTNGFWKPSTGTNLDNEMVTSIDGSTISGTLTVYIATHGGVYRGDRPSGSS
ncbi:MAG: hypothetical protein SVY10_03895, partial [Thermodesulfobacteriota bacterium]|nr:hypothetical protein [Thermodesulfobacteriota bacterium]